MGISEEWVSRAKRRRLEEMSRQLLEKCNAARNLAERLVEEGKSHEEQEKHLQAVEAYQTVVKFGEHVGGERYKIVTQLTGMSIQRRGYEALKNLHQRKEEYDALRKVEQELSKLGERRNRLREQVNKDKGRLRERLVALYSPAERGRLACGWNLVFIGLQLGLYALDHDGWYPPYADGLERLYPDYVGSPELLRCPGPILSGTSVRGEGVPQGGGYIYVPGHRMDDDSPNVIIVMDVSMENHDDGIYVLPRHGAPQWLPAGFSAEETASTVRRRARILYVLVASFGAAFVITMAGWAWANRKLRQRGNQDQGRRGNSA